jgi:hypothetical protein
MKTPTKYGKRLREAVKSIKSMSPFSPSQSPTSKRTCNQSTPDKTGSPTLTRAANRRKELPNPKDLFGTVPRKKSKMRDVQTVDLLTKQETVSAAILGLYGPPWQPGKRSAGPAAAYAAAAVAFLRGFKNPFHKSKVKKWYDELRGGGGAPKSKSNNMRIVGVCLIV